MLQTFPIILLLVPQQAGSPPDEPLHQDLDLFHLEQVSKS